MFVLSPPTYTKGVVDRLKVLAKEREGLPLNDDVQEVYQLCETVESVLRHQQKGTCVCHQPTRVIRSLAVKLGCPFNLISIIK